MSRVPLGSSRTGGSRSPLLDERYPDGLVGPGRVGRAHRTEMGPVARRAGRLFGRVAPQGGGCGIPRTVRLAVAVRGRGRRRRHEGRDRARRHHDRRTRRGFRPAFRTDEMVARFPDLDWRITAGNSSPLTDGGVRRPHHERGEGERARPHPTCAIPRVRRRRRRPAVHAHRTDSGHAAHPRAQRSDDPRPRRLRGERGVRVRAARRGRTTSTPIPTRLNPWGGAIALGHAVGASGTRLLGTLLANLEATGGRYGLQTMCEGGGMANATLIERL